MYTCINSVLDLITVYVYMWSYTAVSFAVININAKGYNKIKLMENPFGYVFMDSNRK